MKKEYPEQIERECTVRLRGCQKSVLTGDPDKAGLKCWNCADELNRRRMANEGYHQ